jgi:hypothetical protein
MPVNKVFGLKAIELKTVKRPKPMNIQRILTWLIQMKPGEEQKKDYLYQVYIHD